MQTDRTPCWKCSFIPNFWCHRTQSKSGVIWVINPPHETSRLEFFENWHVSLNTRWFYVKRAMTKSQFLRLWWNRQISMVLFKLLEHSQLIFDNIFLWIRMMTDIVPIYLENFSVKYHYLSSKIDKKWRYSPSRSHSIVHKRTLVTWQGSALLWSYACSCVAIRG